MKIKTITYRMLRVTEQFENDAVEVTVQLNANEDEGEAVRMAKSTCEKALATRDNPPRYQGF